MINELRHSFDYVDGALYWKNNRTNTKLIGQRAGCIKNDYCAIGFNGKKFQEHRLIVLWHGKVIGENDVVHHIDGNKLNNRIENLVVWDHDFHKNWHIAQRANPICAKFKIGGLYNKEYLRAMSSPSGSIRSHKRGPKGPRTKPKTEDEKKAYRREYYQKNKQRILNDMKAYYKKNREDRLAYQREYDASQTKKNSL